MGNKLDGVILSTSRVVLSTDDPPDFYVVVARDKRIPGIELRLTRYVQDIRRLNYGDLSRNEYTKRMLLDFGLGLGIFPEEGNRFNIEEVKLEQFLATQMARRIKTAFEENPKGWEGIEVKSVHGKFVPHHAAADWGSPEKRFGRFAIALETKESSLETWGVWKKEDEEKILGSTLAVILEVLQGYHFTSFDSVEIKAFFLEQPFVVSRDVLELYRHKKIGLSELFSPKNFNLSPHDTELLLKQ